MDRTDLGPIAALLAALAAAAANISGFAASMGASAFACDAAGALAFTFAAVYSSRRAWAATRPLPVAGFVHGTSPRRRWTTSAFAQAAQTLLLLSIALWFALPVIEKMLHREWRICGTMTTSCSSTYCAVGLDHRRRVVAPACVPQRDSSGYLLLESVDWTTYRPEYLRVLCEGKEIFEVQVPATLSSPTCDALLELR